jgi:DNA-binding NtrC family response regulator
VIGRSPALLVLRRRIARVAPTEATVLILGERGTGKELVADAIHAGSRRGAGAYVKINCAALSGDLLASELFGHERGAFTGAHARHEGLLRAASGGTVFLDEVGDLSPAGQAMLLRFLQEREVRPVGARHTAQVDVRVIAATNRDLAGAIARDEFRADLHDRLREVVVEVPPLRERRVDIPLLAEHFLQAASVRHRRARLRLSPGARRALQQHAWPGNVRELEQTLSAAVVLAGPGPLRAWELFPDLDPAFGVNAGRHGALPASALAQVPALAPSPALAPAQRLTVVPTRPSEIGGAEPINHRQLVACELAARRGGVCRLDLVRRFAVSRETARRDLARLVAAGLLRREGAGKWARYVRPAAAQDCRGGKTPSPATP